ncbi:hypothetical protein D9Q98_004353 [Chlorella vulgaris]|uniref:Uncharacterized protein n=1 Tax=Chlorella vulgaris TaxID=3077 RepID=A0A9D4TPU0_CHLVU|nr:hypothetical protein D9Q98_004353 [Chlorella vulgaris]
MAAQATCGCGRRRGRPYHHCAHGARERVGLHHGILVKAATPKESVRLLLGWIVQAMAELCGPYQRHEHQQRHQQAAAAEAGTSNSDSRSVSNSDNDSRSESISDNNSSSESSSICFDSIIDSDSHYLAVAKPAGGKHLSTAYSAFRALGTEAAAARYQQRCGLRPAFFALTHMQRLAVYLQRLKDSHVEAEALRAAKFTAEEEVELQRRWGTPIRLVGGAPAPKCWQLLRRWTTAGAACMP